MLGQSDIVNINLYTKHFVAECPATEEAVSGEDQLWLFCRDQLPEDELSILLKVDLVTRSVRYMSAAKYTFAKLVDIEGAHNSYIKGVHDSHIVLQDFYIRNKKLYLRTKSPFAEWKTSLHLLCTSFFKILSNEIYCKAPAKLRLRAIACTVAVPTVVLMGVLMPFASYYFNRIVGDLDCWVNDYNNHDIALLSPSQRQIKSGRCFAVDVQPYAFIDIVPNNAGDINIYNFNSYPCVPILADYINKKYLNGGLVVMHNCKDKDGTFLHCKLVRGPV